MMRASTPPGIKVGNAACELPLLLDVLLQPAVVHLDHSCIINAEFQPNKEHKHCLDFKCTKGDLFK